MLYIKEETLIANMLVGKYTDYTTVNPLLSPPGGLFFSSSFEGGLNREGGLKREGGAYLIQQNASPEAKIPWYETEYTYALYN